MAKDLVFRVSCIPSNAKVADLLSVLSREFPSHKVDMNETAIVPSCYDNKQTAFIQFLTDAPEKLKGLPDGDTYEIWYNRDNRQQIHIDKDFYELTQLYPTEGKITADIVAVSGLNGHAYGSWRGRGNLRSMWLRDFLPADLPSCRMMLFGCNTKLSSNGTHTVSDYAGSLLEELTKVRQNEEEKKRPLVFIGHSFGGVIIAQAVVKAKEDDIHHGPLFPSTRAIIFFGTPHRGLSVGDLLDMVEKGSAREKLVKYLNVESNELAGELMRFKRHCGSIKIVSFHEANTTRKVVTGEGGRFTNTGEYFMRVDRQSSILELPSSIEQVHLAEGDHSEMVKFKNKSQQSYTSVVRHLKDFTNNAGVVTQTAEEGLENLYFTASSAVISKSASGLQRILKVTPSLVNEKQRNNTTTLLHMAIENADEASIRVLLGFSPDLGIVDKNNQTALQLGASMGYEGIVNAILLAYPRANTTGRTADDMVKALALASEKGHHKTVEVLLKAKVDIMGKDDKGNTALYYAAMNGHATVVEALLRHKPDISARSSKGSTPLLCAAQHGHKSVVELLLGNGANITEVLSTGHTALHLAAYQGHKEVVEVLLANKSNTAAKDTQGNTPLHHAASQGKEGVVNVLLSNGALIDTGNIYGTTAYKLAVVMNHGRVAKIIADTRARRMAATARQPIQSFHSVYRRR